MTTRLPRGTAEDFQPCAGIDKANAEAGKKAFVVNRVGDFGFLVAMFLIWVTTQKLDFIGAHAALGAMAGTPVVPK